MDGPQSGSAELSSPKILRMRLLLALFLLATPLLLRAQYTVIVPADVRLITADSIFNMGTGGPVFNYSFLVCAGKKLKVTGVSTYLARFYLEEGATLDIDTNAFSFFIVGDYFLKQNSSLDMNKHLGSPIDTLMVQNTVTVLDTQNMVPTALLPCTTLTFDYSLLPGATSSCNPPLGIPYASAEEGISLQVLPFGQLRLHCSASDRFQLFDMTGRPVLSTLLDRDGSGLAETAWLPSGIYAYRFMAGSHSLRTGLLRLP